MQAVKTIDLLPGEQIIKGAPHTQVDNGQYCVPQHYLTFQHDIRSVEALILDIEFSSRYPIFVNQDNQGIYIQVGIIGQDNYATNDLLQKDKIVYGRKWRVEPSLPTSEIIQTVFLALKKAREHEIRELFRYRLSSSTTTPFNSHHDLPLLALFGDKIINSEKAEPINTFSEKLTKWLHQIDYANCCFELIAIEQRPNKKYLVDLLLNPNTNSNLPELTQPQYISIVLDNLDLNTLSHELISELIKLSDRYVDEHFTYKGFARFSWNVSVEKIAELSAKTRKLHKNLNDPHFNNNWSQSNYSTDLTRVPTLSDSELSAKIKTALKAYSPLAGIPPSQR